MKNFTSALKSKIYWNQPFDQNRRKTIKHKENS